MEQAVAAGGVSVFPGWEFFAGVAAARRYAARSPSALPALRRRAGDDQEPDRSLVEQGRAAARALEHRLADPAGGYLSAARSARGAVDVASRHRYRSARRGGCARRGHDPRRNCIPFAAHAAFSRLDSGVSRAGAHAHAAGDAHAARRSESGRSGAAGQPAARVRAALPARQPHPACGQREHL